MKTHPVPLALLVISLGCATLPSVPPHEFLGEIRHSGKQHTVLLEVPETPKDAFFDAIERAPALSSVDKALIRKQISRDVYTHCSVALFQHSGGTYLELDQCYPRREIGQDSDGRTIVTGGSGSVSLFKQADEGWRPVVGMHYD